MSEPVSETCSDQEATRQYVSSYVDEDEGTSSGPVVERPATVREDARAKARRIAAHAFAVLDPKTAASHDVTGRRRGQRFFDVFNATRRNEHFTAIERLVLFVLFSDCDERGVSSISLRRLVTETQVHRSKVTSAILETSDVWELVDRTYDDLCGLLLDGTDLGLEGLRDDEPLRMTFNAIAISKFCRQRATEGS